MTNKMKKLILSVLVCFAFSFVKAQVGLGMVVGNDLYQRYTNPQGGSAGNAVLNLQVGPKLWVGGDNFSVSVESYVNWGATSLSLREFRGMGSVAIPLMAKLNFNGNSGFSSELTSGWSIGGGYQMSRTEWYGVNNTGVQEGISREIFPVFVGELTYGYGIGGFYVEAFGRYGWDTQSRASTFNLGLSYNINVLGFRKLRKKLERFDD